MKHQTYVRSATKKAVNAELKRDLEDVKARHRRNLEVIRSAHEDETTAMWIVGRGQLASLYGNMYRGKLELVCYLRVSSLKTDKRLISMLNRAVKADLPMKTEDQANEWGASRTFTIDLPFGHELRIRAEVADDSETCRKVEISRKVEERVQYALICD